MSKSLEAQALVYSEKVVSKKLKLDFDFANNLLNLVDRQLHGAEESAKRAEQYYKNTLGEYNRGIKNSPDVLGAGEGLIEARERVMELNKDYQIAKATLMHLLGK